MRTVNIGGKEFNLANSDEVTYGAQKELERMQFKASMSMLSDKDVAELARKGKKKDPKMNEEDFVNRVMSGEIKEALLDSNEAAITDVEEAIILSAGLSRDAILKLPAKTVEKLGKEALEELGTVEDFSEASSLPTK